MVDTMTKVYCTAPWNGLTIREDGAVRTCCVGGVVLRNLNHEPITGIERSPALIKIQKLMMEGKPDPVNCKICIDAERYGGNPLQHHYNREYPNTNSLKLKFVDVRWNNTCNLACQYCNAGFSSTWADRLAQPNGRPIKAYQDGLLGWILERADQVTEIMLVGGEPMLMKQNYALLKILPKTCRISIITNLSYDLSSLPCLDDLLNRPKENIIWNISVENTGGKFEYVRSGAKWEQATTNFKLLMDHWPDNITLNMVYSMFNAFDLESDIVQFHKLGIKKFNLCNINDNIAMNVFNMPVSVQQLAKEQLEKTLITHQDQLHPDDKDLYPLQGISKLIDALTCVDGYTTVAEFEKQIEFYNKWSNVQQPLCAGTKYYVKEP